MSPSEHMALTASLKKMLMTVVVTAVIGVGTQGMIVWRAIPTLQAQAAASATAAQSAIEKADKAATATAKLDGSVKGLTHEIEQLRDDLRQYNRKGR